MRIGDLRHRVTFLKLVAEGDGQGGINENWAEVCTVWGECLPLSGRALYYAQQTLPSVSHQLTIRYRQGIDSAMRVKLGGLLLDIKAVMDVDNRRQALKIMCEEVHPR